MQKHMTKTLIVVVVLLAIAALGTILVAAHGDEHETGESEVIAFEILLNEFTYEARNIEAEDAIVLEAGRTYRITFENTGVIEHEVMIGADTKTMEMEGMEMIHGYHHDLLSDMPVSIVGEMNEQTFALTVGDLSEIRLQPTQQLAIEFTLPDEKVGDYELGCFLPGHYQANMKVPVQVVAAQ